MQKFKIMHGWERGRDMPRMAEPARGWGEREGYTTDGRAGPRMEREGDVP